MPFGARPRIVETMIPSEMNEAKIAKQMMPTMPRFLNDAAVP